MHVNMETNSQSGDTVNGTQSLEPSTTRDELEINVNVPITAVYEHHMRQVMKQEQEQRSPPGLDSQLTGSNHQKYDDCDLNLQSG